METYNITYLIGNINDPSNKGDVINAENALESLIGWQNSSPCCTTSVFFTDDWKDLGLSSNNDPKKTKAAASTWVLIKIYVILFVTSTKNLFEWHS